jgi:hypothetical protein
MILHPQHELRIRSQRDILLLTHVVKFGGHSHPVFGIKVVCRPFELNLVELRIVNVQHWHVS